MKKVILLCLAALVMLFGACGALSGSGDAAQEPEQLSKEVEMLNGTFTISVPTAWMKDYSITDEEMFNDDMILSYTDNIDSFINIYFYDNEYYEYPLNLAVQDILDYYGENIIGEYQQISINNMDAYIFEYSMKDLSVDNDEFNYHGYEYLINTQYGVIDIDIYYTQEVIESKLIKLTEQQLELIQRIAESFIVS